MTVEFDFIEMKYPAKAEYVGVIRMSLSGIANRMGFSYDTIEDIKVAVSEAVTNVVTHAYETEETGELLIGFVVYENKLEIIVSDNGESFNPEEVKDKIGPIGTRDEEDPASQIREGGFGLYLMDALMDEVSLNNDNGVTVLLTKYLEESEVEHVGKIHT